MNDGLLQYNKNVSDKRRPVITASPRKRQQQSESGKVVDNLVKELSDKISSLKEDLKKDLDSYKNNEVDNYKAKTYTEEEVNDIVTKALTDNNLVSTESIAEYESKIYSLEQELKLKDALISELKTLEIKTVNVTQENSTENITKCNRPVMEEAAVIDPSSKEQLESHISIVGSPTEDDSSVEDKVAKLKTMLGGK